MAKNKKNNKGNKKKQIEEAIESDPRFASVKSDPRFKPVKADKAQVEVDERFRKGFKNDLKDKQEEKVNAEEADLLAQLEELNRRARGEDSDMTSSSDESDVADEDLLEQEPVVEEEEEEEEIEDGEATRRLACVNLNWDAITAVDLLSVFKSFSQGGTVYSVTIYMSDFGKKRLADEEKYGPEGRIVEDDVSFDEDDVENEEKVDESRLRKYERERRKYYFAVIECDNKFTANGIYELTDGTEFMRTGSILDLRFIPDDMVFDPSSIKEKATFVPENYTPSVSNCNDVTSHTNVQLSWDGEDQRRTNELVKGRSTKKNEKGEIDYSNYLASSDSSEEEEEDVRAKYSSLLQKAEESESEEGSEQEGDADITFIPGLKATLTKNMEEKAKEEAAAKEAASLSVYEEYRRKLKEKRKQRKQGAEEEDETGVDTAENEHLFADLNEENKREGKGKKRKERRGKKAAAQDPEAAKKQAELELLMIDEGNELKHDFDMKEIRKESGRKGKKRAKEEKQDDFEINTEDPRFRSLVTNSDYSIDVTNPQYAKTKNMAKLVDSVTKKRKKE